jgi:hypothetical protein
LANSGYQKIAHYTLKFIVLPYGITYGRNLRAVPIIAPQDMPEFFPVKICRDRYVISILASTIDAVLYTGKRKEH